MIQRIFISAETSANKNFVWNTLGTGMLAAVTMVFTVIVARMMGEEAGGLFSFALAIGQWIATIAYFEIRTFQVTDIAKKYTYSDYFFAKLFCCLMALLAAVIYIVVSRETGEKCIVILLMCVYKILDGYSDVHEGELQRYGRIDVAGKLLFYRVAGGVAVQVLALVLFKNVPVMIAMMTLYSLFCVGVLNEKVLHYFEKSRRVYDSKKVRGVIRECSPLFISIFLNTYVYSASRMSVDKLLDQNYQLYYAAIFMPVMIVNLFSTFIFKPLLSVMAEYYEERKIKSFLAVVGKICVIILAVTAVCIGGAAILGIPVLSILYGIRLRPYRTDLLILLLAGGVNALAFLLYYVLTIMRKQRFALAGYVMEALTSFAVSDVLVKRYAIRGAALSYLASVSVLLAVFLAGVLYYILKGKKEDEK